MHLKKLTLDNTIDEKLVNKEYFEMSFCRLLRAKQPAA